MFPLPFFISGLYHHYDIVAVKAGESPQIGGDLHGFLFDLVWWVLGCIPSTLHSELTLSLPRVINFISPPVASPEIWHWHCMKNLDFHTLLRWNMILLPILTTSLAHFSLKSWENVLFELGSKRVKQETPPPSRDLWCFMYLSAACTADTDWNKRNQNQGF